MSMSVGQYGANSTNLILSQSIKNNEQSQASISWQIGSGTISSTIEGLGDNRYVALQLGPKMDENNAYLSNISSILSRLDISSKALSKITQLSQGMYNTTTEMLAVANQGDTQLSGSSSTASSDLRDLKQTLNTVDNNGGYVFGVGDGQQRPIPDKGDINDSPLAQKIDGLVSDMLDGKLSASDVFKQATAAASDNSSDLSVFNDSLSISPTEAHKERKNVVIGDNDQTWTAGFVATEGDSNPNETSTGSPVRDLMRNMMLVSALGNHNMSEPGVFDLVQQVQTSMKVTSDTFSDIEAATGSDQNALKSRQGTLKSVGIALADYMSDTISADPSALALQYDNLRSQLQVSFTLISKLKDLSLANYI